LSQDKYIYYNPSAKRKARENTKVDMRIQKSTSSAE
jgi:hypothetical protein